MKKLCYLDTVTFYKVYSGGYGSSKLVETSGEVNCLLYKILVMVILPIKIISTPMLVCYPDPENEFFD